CFVFFIQAEDGIRDRNVTGVQTCALPIYRVGEAVHERGGLAHQGGQAGDIGRSHTPSVPPPAVAGRNSAPGTTVAPGMASSTALPLSVIDFATVRPGQAVGDALRDSVALAQKSEELGYDRVWYAEHHNMGSI